MHVGVKQQKKRKVVDGTAASQGATASRLVHAVGRIRLQAAMVGVG